MSTEDKQEIIDLINQLHPKKQNQMLQTINSIVSGIVLALLVYTSTIIVEMFERVRKNEVEIQNMKRDISDHIDMDLYRSMLIDYNFDVVNINNFPLNKIYQPGLNSRGGSKQ